MYQALIAFSMILMMVSPYIGFFIWINRQAVRRIAEKAIPWLFLAPIPIFALIGIFR